MFGYTEHDHTVISSQTIVRGGKNVQLDVRRPQSNVHILNLLDNPGLTPRKRQEWEREVDMYSRMPDYLVLVRNGNPTYLLYETWSDGNRVSKEEAMVRLQDDVAKLVAEPDVPLEQLGWSERIQNDTGYGRDGSITMY